MWPSCSSITHPPRSALLILPGKKLECRCHFEIAESELPLSKFGWHQITRYVPSKQLTNIAPSSSAAYNAVWNINLQSTALTEYAAYGGGYCLGEVARSLAATAGFSRNIMSPSSGFKIDLSTSSGIKGIYCFHLQDLGSICLHLQDLGSICLLFRN
jgi:hypothetical protein